MIQKDATNTARHARDWTFTNAARTAFELFLRGRSWRSGSSLLLPGYIGYTEREGSGVFDPVRNSGTPYTFYPVGERLQIDLNLIEGLLTTGNHPMILVIHYFGLPHVDMAQMRDLCRKYGTILVEDCAHVPGPVTGSNGLGSYGSAAFHALHKVLPVPDGGVLCMNDGALGKGNLESAERCVPSTLEQVMSMDLAAISTQRRRNYALLLERLSGMDGVEVLYPGIGECVPHDFPVRILNGLREKLYFALMDRGMPTTALYYRMIDEITPQAHPLSHALSKSILNLPVHQDTDAEDIQALCDSMEEELRKLHS